MRRVHEGRPFGGQGQGEVDGDGPRAALAINILKRE
nr:MAG TPA: hypothetical protein [Caudoviricetes sp.]